jgi:ribonuclease HIII
MSQPNNPKAAPITSPRIKELAQKGVRDPKSLTAEQVQELAASVEAHQNDQRK